MDIKGQSRPRLGPELEKRVDEYIGPLAQFEKHFWKLGLPFESTGRPRKRIDPSPSSPCSKAAYGRIENINCLA
jgi:hypothetical protein